jgi:hypothetical protein
VRLRLRVCATPGCPELTDKPRCLEHRRSREKARGTRQQRGYNAAHDRERGRWEPKVRQGVVRCARCGERIDPDERWDLGHTDDRTTWTGPEHADRCNRSAGGKAAHRYSA